MSGEILEIAYEGDAVKGKIMDARLLAQALIGMSDLCTATNQTLGLSEHVTVSVKSNFQAQCFLLGLDISALSHTWDVVKPILLSDDVAAIKELLDWLGFVPELIGGAASLKLIQYIKYRRDRRITTVESLENDLVRVAFSPEDADPVDQLPDTIVINKSVYELGETPAVLGGLAKLTKPLLSPGYESLDLRRDHCQTSSFSKADAEAIQALAKAKQNSVSEITVTLYVHKPTLDPSAKKWHFHLMNNPVEVDISDTDIARQTMRRGSVQVGDAYRVELQVIERAGKNGPLYSYKVIEVLEYIPGGSQPGLL